MMTFLKMVGAAFVAFLLLIVIIVLIIRWKLRRFLSKLTDLADSFQDPVPPFRIKLEPDDEPSWKHLADVAKLDRELAELGFGHIGDFCIGPLGIPIKAYWHAEKATCAVVYDHPVAGAWCDLVRRYADGTAFTYASCPAHGMDAPPKKTTKFFPQESLKQISEELWTDSPLAGAVIVKPEGFPKLFEKVYAEEMNWRMQRGGPTAEEVRRICAKQEQECTDEIVEQIQQQWRTRIADFLSERQLSRFRQISDMSRRELEDLEDRIVVIHNRMLPEGILASVEGDFYPDHGGEEEDDDDDEDDDDRQQRHRWNALLAKVRQWCKAESPRQAFHHLLEECQKTKSFRHLGTVDKPIGGDVWLRPEGDAAEDEEYDDELDDFGAD